MRQRNNNSFKGGVSNMKVVVEGYAYEIIENVKDGFKEENFTARFSEVLLKYDYIVGDWGYGQLRLKGFFDDRNQKSTFDTKISTFQDYLYEYCNFGCAYFIAKKVGKAEQPKPVEVKEPVEAKAVEIAEA
jgi:uncharacterized protein YutD